MPLPHVPEQKAGGLQRDRPCTELQLIESLFTEVLCSHIGRCFQPVSDEISRVLDDIYPAIAAKASAEGVSLLAIAARLLSDDLKSGSESPDKPAWAIALESRVSQLEAQTNGTGTRKGKRRR